MSKGGVHLLSIEAHTPRRGGSTRFTAPPLLPSSVATLFFPFFQIPPILALRDALIDVLEECTNLLMSEERRGRVYFPASCIELDRPFQEDLVTAITGNGQEISRTGSQRAR